MGLPSSRLYLNPPLKGPISYHHLLRRWGFNIWIWERGAQMFSPHRWHNTFSCPSPSVISAKGICCWGNLPWFHTYPRFDTGEMQLVQGTEKETLPSRPFQITQRVTASRAGWKLIPLTGLGRNPSHSVWTTTVPPLLLSLSTPWKLPHKNKGMSWLILALFRWLWPPPASTLPTALAVNPRQHLTASLVGFFLGRRWVQRAIHSAMGSPETMTLMSIPDTFSLYNDHPGWPYGPFQRYYTCHK